MARFRQGGAKYFSGGLRPPGSRLATALYATDVSPYLHDLVQLRLYRLFIIMTKQSQLVTK